MGRIEIGVQKAHRDRLDAFGGKQIARCLDARAVKRLMLLAGGEQALFHLARQPPRHQRPVLVEQEVVGLGPVAAADDVDVAGAARDDQGGLGAVTLDQRIDGDGRAMDQFVNGRGLDAALAQAVDDALHQMRRRGQAFGLHELLRLFIEADEIGESSANIDRNHKHADAPPPTLCHRSGLTRRSIFFER